MKKWIAVVVIAAMPGLVLAASPAYVPVQAFLTDADGNPLDGEHTFHLKLYDGAMGGQVIFEETQVAQVEGGLLTLYLGQVQTLDLALFRDQDQVYLGLAVDDDAQMQPLLPIGTAPFAAYATHAGDAASLQGHPATDFRLAADSVDWADLANLPTAVEDGDDDSLAGITCLDGQVLQVVSGAWDCGDVAAGGVTSLSTDVGLNADQPTGDVLLTLDRAQLDGWYVEEGQAASISSAMLQNEVVSSQKLASNSVWEPHIAPEQVGTTQLADGAVTPDKMAWPVAKADVVCPAGQFMTGIDAAGDPVCAAPTPPSLSCTARSAAFAGSSTSVNCQSGEIITGGGFYLTDGPNNGLNWNSAAAYPSGNGYYCFREIYSGGTSYCYAICCTLQ